MSQESFSIVEYHSKHEKSRCGYCHSPNTNYNYGMTTKLNVEHYQALIDRGWRRSGGYCYKPIMTQICCPPYTIRCEALNFKISKSQKKILKRMVKFLKNELKDEAKTSQIKCDEDTVRGMEFQQFSKYSEKTEQNTCEMQVTSVSDELSNRLSSNISNTESCASANKQSSENVASLPSPPMEISRESRQKNFDPTRAPQKKAKLLRIERKLNKLLAQGKTQEEINVIMSKRKTQNSSKTLEDYFNEISNCSKKLELRLVKIAPLMFDNSAQVSYELYKKYQTVIHGEEVAKLKKERFASFLVKSPMRIRMVKVKSDEFSNTFKESAKLFKKYQMTIHKDKPEECDESPFSEFLVHVPMEEWIPKDGPPQGYGSFHEQYWLDGELIAVAVIDILPSCVSSVYFFYDPAYSYLSLGTFSSLREVALTRQLNKFAPNLQYYYMGFYIHSCIKMRYKAKLRPSKLLCPETFVWCDIEKCLPKLDISKYSRLNEDLSAKDDDVIDDIQQVAILYRRQGMRYGAYKRFVKDEDLDDEIREYASLVGKTCALNMLYYISE